MSKAQITSGIWSVLSNSFLYQLGQDLVGATSGRKKFVEEYVRPKAGDRILDIGCGPAKVLNFLGKVEYTGLDLSPTYIETARKKFGNRGAFHCISASELDGSSLGLFDVVLTLGVFHHLSDAETTKVFEQAYRLLKPGGRLLSLDPTYVPNQNALCRWLIRNDRGKNIRGDNQLKALASTQFQKIKCSIRHDFFRVPYSLVLLECTR